MEEDEYVIQQSFGDDMIEIDFIQLSAPLLQIGEWTKCNQTFGNTLFLDTEINTRDFRGVAYKTHVMVNPEYPHLMARRFQIPDEPMFNALKEGLSAYHFDGRLGPFLSAANEWGLLDQNLLTATSEGELDALLELELRKKGTIHRKTTSAEC